MHIHVSAVVCEQSINVRLDIILDHAPTILYGAGATRVLRMDVVL